MGASPLRIDLRGRLATNTSEVMEMTNVLPTGMKVEWSRMNQAWLVVWLGHVLGIKNTVQEVQDYLLETYGVEWMPS